MSERAPLPQRLQAFLTSWRDDLSLEDERLIEEARDCCACVGTQAERIAMLERAVENLRQAALTHLTERDQSRAYAEELADEADKALGAYFENDMKALEASLTRMHGLSIMRPPFTTAPPQMDSKPEDDAHRVLPKSLALLEAAAEAFPEQSPARLSRLGVLDELIDWLDRQGAASALACPYGMAERNVTFRSLIEDFGREKNAVCKEPKCLQCGGTGRITDYSRSDFGELKPCPACPVTNSAEGKP